MRRRHRGGVVVFLCTARFLGAVLDGGVDLIDLRAMISAPNLNLPLATVCVHIPFSRFSTAALRVVPCNHAVPVNGKDTSLDARTHSSHGNRTFDDIIASSNIAGSNLGVT